MLFLRPEITDFFPEDLASQCLVPEACLSRRGDVRHHSARRAWTRRHIMWPRDATRRMRGERLPRQDLGIHALSAGTPIRPVFSASALSSDSTRVTVPRECREQHSPAHKSPRTIGNGASVRPRRPGPTVINPSTPQPRHNRRTLNALLPRGTRTPVSPRARAASLPETTQPIATIAGAMGPVLATGVPYRMPGCFTSIPLSCIFSCSTLGETSNAVARLMYSLVTK